MKTWQRRRPKFTARPQRRGWTLLELMAVITILTILLSIVGTLFATLTRSERNVMRSCAMQQSLSRLNELFRTDVHRSDAAVIAADDQGRPTCTLTSAGEHIAQYIVQDHDLVRLASVVAGDHREIFRIPDADWTFESRSENSRKIRLRLQRPVDTPLRVQRDVLPEVVWDFEALLGLLPKPVLSKGSP